METNSSPLSQIDDGSSTLSWFPDDYPINTDMIVPLSPPLSTSSSSPASIIKKSKLSPVERRMRKKGQNKTAAEKYRIKKKSERNQLLDRHMELKCLNKELKSELENLSYRLQQFKQLFNDFVQSN
jgi:cyclic AMP-dependent transcription factor ATF-4